MLACDAALSSSNLGCEEEQLRLWWGRVQEHACHVGLMLFCSNTVTQTSKTGLPLCDSTPLLLLHCTTGTEEPIPVVTSQDLDEVLYADTKRCPHLNVLMQASEHMLQGKATFV